MGVIHLIRRLLDVSEQRYTIVICAYRLGGLFRSEDDLVQACAAVLIDRPAVFSKALVTVKVAMRIPASLLEMFVSHGEIRPILHRSTWSL